MTSSRDAWAVTTHEWSRDVDGEHLRQVRADAELVLHGGLQHLVPEVLAYAADEAEHQGRVGQVTVRRHSTPTTGRRGPGRRTMCTAYRSRT